MGIARKVERGWQAERVHILFALQSVSGHHPIERPTVYTQVGFSLNTLHHPPQSPFIRGEEYGLAPSPL
jgi:hypothetical protein